MAYEQYGLLSVSQDGRKPTYSAAISDYVPAATATDMITLSGSVGKTISVTAIRLNGAATVAAFANVYMYKRSVADTGGTSTATVITRHDSNDILPSGVVLQYSANPTVGTGTLIRSEHVSFSSAAAGNLVTLWEFGNRPSKTVKLYNAAESIALNFGGAAVPGGANLHVTIEWTEEFTSVT
jgi:hypothetical protein